MECILSDVNLRKSTLYTRASWNRRRTPRIRYTLPALAIMAIALLLRLVAGMPGASTPHHHGALHHTHEAGGVAHVHRNHDPRPTPAAPHRHGDGPYHVLAGGNPGHHHAAPPGPPRTIFPGAPRTGPPAPETKRNAPHEPPRESPAAPGEVPGDHDGRYFCAAAMAALQLPPAPDLQILEPARTPAPCFTDILPRAIAGPRQPRAPPHRSPATHT